MRERLEQDALPLDVFIKSAASVHRVRGTAVFLSTSPDTVPSACCTTSSTTRCSTSGDDPQCEGRGRAARPKATAGGPGAAKGFYRVILHYGLIEEVDVPADLVRIGGMRRRLQHDDPSFFLGRQKLMRAEAARHGAVARGCSPG